MKNVVFKVKFNHPNRHKTPKLNVNHFSYISKRPRAIYNRGKTFCCFGKVAEIGYKNFGDIDNFEDMRKHILLKSKEKTTFYKGIISLTEEDALQKGFDKRAEWEQLIKDKASKIAKEMGINAENFEYVCSVHMEKGHPHLHFMAWDKNQEILRERIPMDRLNNIRKTLTSYVFKEDLQNLYLGKNTSKEEYKDTLKTAFKEINHMFDMTDEEYKKYVKEITSMKPDTFTKTGYFIVLTGLTESGSVKVNDSFSEKLSNMTFSPELISEERKGAWAFSYNKFDSEGDLEIE